MTAANVLIRLQDMGLTLASDGEKLIVTPKSAITDEVRGLIRARKDDLLALLVPPANDPPDLNTLANGIAKEFGINPDHVLTLLDDDDRKLIQAGDQATIEAWRCAVEPRMRRGEWVIPPLPVKVTCASCQHAQRTEHPVLVSCVAGRQAPGSSGLWWSTDRHECGDFKEVRP